MLFPLHFKFRNADLWMSTKNLCTRQKQNNTNKSKEKKEKGVAVTFAVNSVGKHYTNQSNTNVNKLKILFCVCLSNGKVIFDPFIYTRAIHIDAPPTMCLCVAFCYFCAKCIWPVMLIYTLFILFILRFSRSLSRSLAPVFSSASFHLIWSYMTLLSVLLRLLMCFIFKITKRYPEKCPGYN